MSIKPVKSKIDSVIEASLCAMCGEVMSRYVDLMVTAIYTVLKGNKIEPHVDYPWLA